MLNRITVLYFFFAMYLTGMSYFLLTHQFYNTDIEAYMGLVYKANYPDMKIEDIHKKVFDELEKNGYKHAKNDLSGREEVTLGENSYYKIIAKDPQVFQEEIQLFAVKPFYNFVNSMFFKIGFEASTSTFLVSVISYILILVLILVFLQKILNNHYLALLITVMLSLFKPLLDASRHATPDNLSCLLLLLSFYFFIIKRNLIVSTIFVMLCVFTRPEYIIFYTLLYGLLFFQRCKLKVRTRELAISFAYVLSSYILIQFFNQISWSTLFMNQFVKVQLYPVSNPDVFLFSDYFRVIKSKILFEFNSSYFPLLLLFTLIILAKKNSFKNIYNINPQILFFAIIYIAVLIRFFIFPMFVTRMMLGFYLLIILSLIYINNSKKNLFKSTEFG